MGAHPVHLQICVLLLRRAYTWYMVCVCVCVCVYVCGDVHTKIRIWNWPQQPPLSAASVESSALDQGIVSATSAQRSVASQSNSSVVHVNVQIVGNGIVTGVDSLSTGVSLPQSLASPLPLLVDLARTAQQRMSV